MKKLILVLLLIPIYANAQKVKNGVIMDKNSYSLGLSYNERDRFTPTIEDVSAAEYIIKANKGAIKKYPNYYSSRGRGIFCGYNRRYFRQYFGFINEEKQKMMVINFVPNNKKWLKTVNVHQLINVLDGGNGFWQALVNLDTGKLVDISINAEV